MDDLRTRRRAAGLTQSELARRTGIAQPNIAAIEAGRRTPSPATRERIDAALRPRPSTMLATRRDDVIAVLARHSMTNPRVFGSVAAGSDQAGSDIDLLVDAARDLDLLDIVDAADELEALLETRVDIVTSRSLRPGHEIARTAVPV